jgi:LmbE family N-acetylglucosaminyl deacetylase
MAFFIERLVDSCLKALMKKVLAIVAHPDDETLGCGATLIKHIQNGDEVRVLVMTDGETSRQAGNASQRKEQFERVCRQMEIKHFSILSFEDQRLDSYPFIELTRGIRELKDQYSPDIVYTHSVSDLNIDHQLTAKAALTVFRPFPNEKLSKLLSFEIPASSEWSSVTEHSRFTPNYFVKISKDQLNRKIAALSLYKGELRDYPHPRSEEYIRVLAQHRGATIGTNLAEAFMVERIIDE